MNGSFLQMCPGFVHGCYALHNLLTNATFVLCVAGLLVMANQAFREHSIHSIKRGLIRLVVIVISLTGLPAWGDLLTDATDDLVNLAGLPNGRILETFKSIIDAKFGTGSVPSIIGSSGSGNAQPTDSGLRITRFGYAGDTTGDPASLNGQGAFPFDSSPHSMIPLKSAALSPDVAMRYNLVPGQEFTATTADGGTLNLRFDDKTSEDLTGRVDIYDPNGQVSNDGVAVTGINGGAVTAGLGQSAGGSFFSMDPFVWVTKGIVLIISLIALSVMWAMNGFREMLYMLAIAFSPLFLGMFALRALSGIATKFILGFTSICLWVLGWSAGDLITRALLEWELTPTGASGLSIHYGGFILISVWSLISSFLAPLIISKSLMAGSTGIMELSGAVVARTVSTAAQVGVGPARMAAQSLIRK